VSEPPSEAPGAARPQQPLINTRPYRWSLGVFGLLLVAAFSVYLFVSRGGHGPGVPAGARLPPFVAPLATSNLNGDANTNPRCDPAHPNPRALNVCRRSPLVLGLFLTGSGTCKRQIDVIQSVAQQFRTSQVQFAAVAVYASHADTAALVRSHRWTIPVAYDRDGAVGSLYGVSVCPMVELAYRGGVVAERLIGDRWLTDAALAPRVRALLRGPR
jgi:hypothetical protein